MTETIGFFNSETEMVKDLERLAKKVAKSDSTVLITGESGTGKSLLARYIHENSRRRIKDLYTVNCAALPDELLESELFGHTKGSFTGALVEKIGKLQMADGGSVFLDEIGELSLRAQSSLLRFLQEKEFERVGSVRPIKVDTRIISATNKDLSTSIKEKNFREDLFFRLGVITIRMPSLRERSNDIPLLGKRFFNEFNSRREKPLSVKSDFFSLLKNYPWPGNIRELKNAMERVCILSDDFPDVRFLKEEINSKKDNEIIEKLDYTESFVSLDQIERNYISQVLSRSDSLSAAAKVLGVNPSTLWRKRKEYELEFFHSQ